MAALPNLKAFMKLKRVVQSLLLSVTLATGAAALAQVQFSIHVGPPEPIHETMPILGAGYAWAPGYWAWNHDRHIWIRGRTIVQRAGYRWEPDRWEQRGDSYYRQPGNWMRDSQQQPPKAQQAQQMRQDKRAKRSKNNPSQRPAKRGPWDDDQGNNRR